jgi:predicted hydrocarbon binding protein
MFYEGRKLFGFLVEVISRPGVLAAITLKFAERGLDITYCSTKGARAGEKGVILLFVDFTDSDVDPDSLAEELKALEFVEKVGVIKPKVKGFIADEVSFPLLMDDARGVLIDEAALKGFLVGFREHLGTGGEAMLYHLGVDSGGYADLFLQAAGSNALSHAAEVAAPLYSGLFTSLGLGRLKILELREEPPYVVVRMHQNIECALGGKWGSTFSQFLKGTLTGVASILFNREMFTRETRRVAKGDPHCEFKIKAK